MAETPVRQRIPGSFPLGTDPAPASVGSYREVSEAGLARRKRIEKARRMA